MGLVEFEDKKLVNYLIYLSERSSKKKSMGSFPFSAIQAFKAEYGELWDQIPEKNFSVNSFNYNPLYLEKQRCIQNPAYRDFISELGQEKASTLFNADINFVTHHWAHLYSALAQSPFSRAIVVVADGFGNRSGSLKSGPESFLAHSDPHAFESISAYAVSEGRISPLMKKWIHREHGEIRKDIIISEGLGILFENASTVIFGNWMHAGKVMGLSAYGKPSRIDSRENFCRYLEKLELQPAKSKREFDSLSRERYSQFADISASVQVHFEETMLEILRDLRRSHEDYDQLILVGGCALNCLLNDRILRDKIFSKVFVPAFPNDEGISLGTALAIGHERNLWDIQPVEYKDLSPAHGALNSDASLQQKNVPALFEKYKVSRPQDLIQKVAVILKDNKVVGWFQGRGEVGPRALGNRSILVRPDRPDVKEHLNTKVKFRESFRPYGATILHEYTSEFFEVDRSYQSPFMTFAPKVRPTHLERVAGVVHIDGTCRIQTLMREQNPLYYSLIQEFFKLSGLPVLLNTSMNIMGQPILETAEDALILFSNSGIDCMVIGEYLIER